MLSSICKDEDCQAYSEDSISLDGNEKKEYSWTGQPIDAVKYFGPQSRSKFNTRLFYLSHKKNQMVHAGDMSDRIPLDFKDKGREELYFPFAPQRPTSEEETGDDNKDNSMDDSVSGITGGSEFQDIVSTLSSMSTLSFGPKVRSREGEPTSPRSKFISACMQGRMNPRASLVTRKNLSKRLELQHHGMGDDMGLVLSTALGDMPFMDSINLADNNLTDISLHPILVAIASVPSLTYLNLSENKMDSMGSKQLTEFLSNSECPLQTLVLKKCDVDDHECQAFVLALSANTHLKSFDLSYNLLGSSEILNTVQPDIVTAGEAFGDLLGENKCPLEELYLGWNMVRMEGAISLAKGLGKNWYLRHLDLSYNSFGVAGGEQLGAALLTNQTIQVLNLQSNNLNSSACFTICVAIEWNTSLRSVCFDGNPIGQLGAKVLMQLPQICGSRVKVSAARCNISIKYEKDDMVNMENPSNIYDLKLDDPYERAICLKLLSLVASHPTYEFNKVLYSPPPKVSKVTEAKAAARNSSTFTATPKAAAKKTPVVLLQSTLRDATVQDDADKLELLAALKAIQKATSDPLKIEQLFKQYDEDESGSLDVDELKSLLDSIGLHIELSALEEAFDTHDIDGGGELELNEFQEFIREQGEEATMRIKELCEISIMLDASTRNRYIPPTKGSMYMSVGNTYTNKGNHRVMSSLNYNHLMEVINKGTESVSKALIYSIQNTKLRVREAIHIFNHLNREMHDRAEALSYILPSMVEAKDAKTLLLKVMNYDKVIYTRLQGRMGNSLRPIIGQFDGYYSLDLSRHNDRLCMTRLLEQSQNHRAECVSNGIFGPGTTGDLSQWGDWSCFRNAFVGKVATHISPDMFNPMPFKGKIHFDFSGSPKISVASSAAINDTKFVNALCNLSLISEEEIPDVKATLRDLRDRTMQDLRGDGTFKPYTNRLQAEATQLFMLQFYTSLPKREKVYQEAEAVRMEGEKLAGTKKSVVEEGDDIDEKKILTILRSMSSKDFINLETVNALDDSAVKGRGASQLLEKKHSGLMKRFQQALPTLALTRGASAQLAMRLESAKKIVQRHSNVSTKRPQITHQASDEFSFDDDDDSDEDDATPNALRALSSALSLVANNTVRRKAVETENASDDLFSRSFSRTESETPKSNTTPISGNSRLFGNGKESDTKTSARTFPPATTSASASTPIHRDTEATTSSTPKFVDAPTDNISSNSMQLPSTLMTTRRQPPKLVTSESSDKLLTSVQTPTSSAPGVVMRPSLLKKSSTVSDINKLSKNSKPTLEKRMSFTPYDAYGAPLVRRDTIEERNQKRHNPKKLLPSDTMEYLQEFSKNVQEYGNDSAKAAKLLDALIEVCNRVWILARHLAVAVEHFTSVNTKKTEFFGSYRVDLVVALFGRVTDVHNIDVVLRELTPFEVACVRCRLGILNLFNPLKPEGNITLNLCNRDERMVAKILAALSLDEPGDNWLDPTFRWSFEKVPVPGWMLTHGWLQDSGMPTKGILSIEYYSGDGKRLRGCAPEVAARKSYLPLVRINEQDLINDTNNKLSAIGGRPKIHTELVGVTRAKANSGIWFDLICPARSTSSLIAHGDNVGTTLRKFGVFALHRPFVLRVGDDMDQADIVQAELDKAKAMEKGALGGAVGGDAKKKGGVGTGPKKGTKTGAKVTASVVGSAKKKGTEKKMS